MFNDDVVYVKTETKPFTQSAYLAHFLEGHNLSALHSRLAKSRIFRKPFKIIISSTLTKNMSQNFMVGLSPSHCISCS